MIHPKNPKLIEPLPAHRIDEAKLFAYLTEKIEGFADPIAVRQFQGGQSNPTFLIECSSRSYVLRKRPPGKLLQSAHQVDREYRIQHALGRCAFPVAQMLHYCGDADVLGTEFYVMAYLQGRVLNDPMMPALSLRDRAAVQRSMFQAIATLHAVDYAQVGLENFGRSTNYVARQLKRFRQQYEAVVTEDLPAMNRLMDWLDARIPATEAASIVHGDFRLANMMLHPTEPRIIAVLDWELSTLGDPLADLAYTCLCFHMPPMAEPEYSGYAGIDLAPLGLLDEAACLDIYCRHTGHNMIGNWNFYLGFALFRSAAILEGVYARALAGNAVDEGAVRFHAMTKMTAQLGLDIVHRTPHA